MVGWKDLAKGLVGDQWTLGAAKDVNMEQFWSWVKVDFIDGSGDMFLGLDRWNYFEKELWLDLR